MSLTDIWYYHMSVVDPCHHKWLLFLSRSRFENSSRLESLISRCIGKRFHSSKLNAQLVVAIQLLRLGFFEDFSGERGGQGSILTPSTFIFQEESEKYRHHLLQADFISFFVKVNVKKSKKLIKKSYKKPGLHPLFRRYIFREISHFRVKMMNLAK